MTAYYPRFDCLKMQLSCLSIRLISLLFGHSGGRILLYSAGAE
jgi:hypothetical protein